MSTFGEIAQEIYDLINDSEYELSRARKDVAQAVREIENMHTFEYMDTQEQIVKSQGYFITSKTWKRPYAVKLFIQEGSIFEFAHFLQQRQNQGDRVPVNMIPDQSVPTAADNRQVPYWYAFGRSRMLADGSLGHGGPGASGREVNLWPEPDSDNLYMVELNGYAYSTFDLSDEEAVDDEFHWLFDNAKNAVVAKACMLTVKFTDDREALLSYMADFDSSSSKLVDADVEMQEDESSPISMEYAGENPAYNDHQGVYPPHGAKSRVIHGEGN